MDKCFRMHSLSRLKILSLICFLLYIIALLLVALGALWASNNLRSKVDNPQILANKMTQKSKRSKTSVLSFSSPWKREALQIAIVRVLRDVPAYLAILYLPEPFCNLLFLRS